MSARAQSNKDVWPYWFEPASTSGVPVQSGVDAPPEHLGWALVRSPNPIKELANRKILNRRHFAAAVSVAFFSVSGGAEESKAVIDDNAQRTAKAVAEAQVGPPLLFLFKPVKFELEVVLKFLSSQVLKFSSSQARSRQSGVSKTG